MPKVRGPKAVEVVPHELLHKFDWVRLGSILLEHIIVLSGAECHDEDALFFDGDLGL